MKHHIEAIVSVPICCDYGRSNTIEDLETCLAYTCAEPCLNFRGIYEDDECGNETYRCGSLVWVDRRMAFDCSSYEFDEAEGFKSRGRKWAIDDIQKLIIDGEQIFPPLHTGQPNKGL